MSRSPNLAVYGEPDFAEFATAYGFVLAKNHPFLDENKRTAFVDVELSLRLNGYVSNADEASCVLTILALAAMLYLSFFECVFVSSLLLRGEAPLLREISSLISQKSAYLFSLFSLASLKLHFYCTIN